MARTWYELHNMPDDDDDFEPTREPEELTDEELEAEGLLAPPGAPWYPWVDPDDELPF